jgi:hypothetical protein
VEVFYPAFTRGRKELIAYFRFIEHRPRIENDAYNNPLIVFVAAVKFLPSRCLAKTGRIRVQAHILVGGIHKVHAEIGSVAVIYTKVSKKTG